MKLWKKSNDSLDSVTQFTAGRDRELDNRLARFDVLGSMAHITMLEQVGLLPKEDLIILLNELRALHARALDGTLLVEEGVEDIHSQVELELTNKLGEAGKKIHSGRSRNDQVLVDIKMYLRDQIFRLVLEISNLFEDLIRLSEKHRNHLLPGYTHLQLAMPSSFGLWFGAYAESLSDDLLSLQAAWRYANRNPLGSAAGYGSSFPLDRELTTRLLGFEGLHVNVVNAQMSRGKTEKLVAQALGNVAATLGRFSMDACVYLNPNFGFISFPDELTTGSSIMPHKKNPDVFEIIRARCNQLQALPGQIAQVMANLPSGYHRDLQVLKEDIFPAFETLNDCIQMTRLMLAGITVRENLLEQDQYKFLFSVEEVNKRVLAGVPFRDAYRQVGQEIEAGMFNPDGHVQHTHLGSIGNPGNELITRYFRANLEAFRFVDVMSALEDLVKS